MGLIPDDIVECFEKETEKQYTDIDYMKILANVEARIPNEIVPITEQVLFEADVVGYISMVYDVDKRYCLVTDVDTKYSPRVRLYSLGSGKETTCKINKITFNETPFKKGQLIKCGRFYQKDRQRKVLIFLRRLLVAEHSCKASMNKKLILSGIFLFRIQRKMFWSLLFLQQPTLI